jgi:hypothetical protein
MNWSKAFDIGIILVAMTSFSFLIGPSAIRGITVISNGTAPIAPSGATEFLFGIGPYVGLLVSGLLWLCKHLKDRNWKKKYENVIVTKPLP